MHRTTLGGLVGGLLIAGGSITGWMVNHPLQPVIAHPERPISVYVLPLASGRVFLSEDPHNHRLQKLRESQHLDDVVRGETTDLDRLIALARWTFKQFPEGTPYPNYPPWNAKVILSAIHHKITGGNYTQYAVVFGQSCQSLGYVVRYVDLADKPFKDRHFLAEVYLPKLNKWVTFRVMKGSYYADAAGNPLSALDLHQVLVGHVKGPVFLMPSHQPAGPDELAFFYHLSYYLRNNFLTVPVFILAHGSSQGPAPVFENDRLRWQDEFTGQTTDMDSTPASSNTADFDFPVDLKHPLDEQRGILGWYHLHVHYPAGQILRMDLSRNTLAHFILGELDATGEYHPLRWHHGHPLELADAAH